VRVIVGEPIPVSTLARLPDTDRIAYLRTRTYLLSHPIAHRVEAATTETVADIPVAAAVNSEALTRDVEALTAEHLLVTAGALRVYCAPAQALPHVLPEIGRLRELTFRAAGEGTGAARDLDAYDAYYHHLFAWDPRSRRIVGAYRLGLTGEILPTRGSGGLYTATLFDYDARLLSGIGPSIELGRSFVRQEEQRGYAALLALWRGIAAFIAKHPEYRCVFGAVSISSRYQSLSRELLVRFLSSAALRSSAARLVRSRRPLPAAPANRHVIESATVTSLESVSSLVEAIEPDGKSVPVLLRQYLNLNARLLGFSVDPAFGDALDGLMVANLTEVPRPMLQRLMGKREADAFLAHHAAASRPTRLRPRLGRVFNPAGHG